MKKALFLLLTLGLISWLNRPAVVLAVVGAPCPSTGHNQCNTSGGCDNGERCTFDTVRFYTCQPDNKCLVPDDPGIPETPGDPDDPETGGGDEIDIFDGPTSENFRMLNPLEVLDSSVKNEFNSPGKIISRVLLYLYPLAGLALFAMLVWGGLDILRNAHNSNGLKAGRERITTALIGFFLLFGTFWIVQIVSWIFGLSIL